MSNESGVLDAKPIQDRRKIAGLSDLFVATFGMRRQTHAAQIRNNDGMILGEARCQRDPHVAGVTEAVQQDDRRAIAADTHILCTAGDRHLSRAETLRPRRAQRLKGIGFSHEDSFLRLLLGYSASGATAVLL